MKCNLVVSINVHEKPEYLLNQIEEIEFKDPICQEISQAFKQGYEDGELLKGHDLLNTENAALKNFIVGALINKFEISKQFMQFFWSPTTNPPA